MFIGVQEPRYGRRLNLLRTQYELPSCHWWCTSIVELNLLAKDLESFFGSVLPTMTSLSTDSRTWGFALKVITNLLQTAQAPVLICIKIQHQSLSPLGICYRSSCGNTCNVFHATCTTINEVTLPLNEGIWTWNKPILQMSSVDERQGLYRWLEILKRSPIPTKILYSTFLKRVHYWK